MSRRHNLRNKARAKQRGPAPRVVLPPYSAEHEAPLRRRERREVNDGVWADSHLHVDVPVRYERAAETGSLSGAVAQ